ncbi:NAD(P)H-quinone oxidoreductase [Crenobacter cavernae]|uniref:NAD(P)H-quinone oxidoreductase n=1 Tax=Crenobacter cavernae TaxID=2290923 RepID=A0ABY0FAE7_9NEIS|nr:NAD(P)H-quinone oxidoreductase [Crenobacter cavernae]RXZ42611.1 NAD(P)H-quinone oxidoreductase [Crenobacter cavernae]
MLAIVQTANGSADTLVVGDAQLPEPEPGQLRVRVRAAGVNRADIVQREGRYPPPPGVTGILGLEVAGLVDAAPAGSRFQAGDAVFGLVAGGGYAEYALLDEALAIEKPDSLTWEEAASLPEAWMTAWLNLVDVARLKSGETLLVHAGASGVGAAAIQLAGLLGAAALASAGSEAKLEFCRELGARGAFNYRELPDFSEWVKERGGADVVLDPVGASHLAENIAALKRDGRLVLIGVMGGARAELNLAQVLVKRIALIGSTLRGRPLGVKASLAEALHGTVLPALGEGRLRLTLDRVFPVSEVRAAHLYLEENRNLGKVVLSWDLS